MRTFHHPSGRHSRGWRASTAWMRPNGIDSVMVDVSPDPVRTASSVRERVKLNPLLNCPNMTPAITISSGTTPKIRNASSTAPPMTMPMIMTTRTTDSQLSAMLAASRPTGTLTSVCASSARGSTSESTKSWARAVRPSLAVV